ncbi:MAG TPA: F0F1 ATP synthase subunit delta [Burkholderiales bacterium]|nr:F0F1 ATP synthase subunit delta [Burkholderiales bacterium]
MELSWSTFVLEIINFLVLVWILKRFLYKPVLEIIARRKAGIEKTRHDAEALRAEAEKLQEQYQGRLADWSKERQQAREALAREIEIERARKLADMQSDLEQEMEKTRVAETRRQADALHKVEETALLQAAEFATRLLEQGAGPETEARLVELVIDELTKLPAVRVTAIRNSYEAVPGKIEVVSAFALTDDHRKRLEQALAKLAGPEIPLHFEQNKELVAGVRITVGAWILGANLRDELRGLAELADAD